MSTILKIIAFVMLIFPLIYQAIAGFMTRDQEVLKRTCWQTIIMQIIATILAYFIFIKIK